MRGGYFHYPARNTAGEEIAILVCAAGGVALIEAFRRVLDQGRIVEDGPHQELMAAEGRYEKRVQHRF